MKVYRIFNKKTKKYEGFGYDRKSSWFKKPKIHLKTLSKNIYELHVFELILKEKIEL